jgi:cytochrome c oxidase cbb3-type subunit 1
VTTLAILMSAFLLSVIALGFFIWSQRVGLLSRDPKSAEVIFATGELGRVEEPAAAVAQRASLQHSVTQAGTVPAPQSSPMDELMQRARADAKAAPVVLYFFCWAVLWLLVASAAGLTSSIKLHSPDWLTAYPWLTFGRIRTIHLNAVAYGWAPMAGLGIAMFVLPRVLKTELAGARWAIIGGTLWNAGLIAGLGGIAIGVNDGLEWLEIPWQTGILFAIGGAFVGIPLVMTLLRRRVQHLYVSVWYMGAALFWFPTLYVVAKFPGLHKGVEQAAMNWWFGHNVLGLFYTPLALASVYYFLPKVIGRPVQSYNLSLIGFWALAFFYGQAGGHHLVGGPLPAWLITLSIVQSMMMIVPVAAFAVNQYLTLKGHLRALVYSPSLRFIGLGGILYVLSSVEGSFEALRSVSAVAHFTHFTVAHAHFGLYGFVTMVFFGSIYFIMPRITGREWPSRVLIMAHFWLVTIGLAVYFVFLSIGGWMQGLAMLDAARPFMDSVRLTIPWLEWRSVGGSLMVLGHLVFAYHFLLLLLSRAPQRDQATLLHAA